MPTFEIVPDYVYERWPKEQRAKYDRALQAALHRNETALAAADAKLRTLLECTEKDSGNIEAARQVAWLDHAKGRVAINEDKSLRFPQGWPEAIEPGSYVRKLFTQQGWDALANRGVTAPETSNKWVKAWREKLKTTG